MDTTWLSRKYSILGEEANAQMMRARSEAALGQMQGRYIGTQTANYGAEAAARVAAERAQAAQSQAQAGLTTQTASMVAPLGWANVGEAAARAEASRAQAGYMGALSGASGPFVYGGVGMPPSGGPGDISTSFTPAGSKIQTVQPGFAGGTPDVNQPQPKGGPQTRAPKPTTSAKNPKQPIEARSGNNKVPGKGDGRTDTQHAMLAPGEAVLNKAAAEYLGRATIDVLNHVGRIKMGLDVGGTSPDTSTHQQAVQPGQAQAKMPSESGGEGMGFADGTSWWPKPPISGRPGGGGEMIAGFADGTSWWPKPPIPGRPGGGGEMIAGFAEGIPTVPGPGQTITNGSWGPPVGNSGDTGLRAMLGLGVPRIVNPPPVLNAGNKPLPRFAGGTDNIPPAPSGATATVQPLMAFVMGTSQVPDARDVVNRKGGKNSTVSKPGSDVLDRWNTGLPMYAKGTSKVPGKTSTKTPSRPTGKAAGLTPGLIAALMGAGMGGQPGALGPSMPMAAPAMGR